MILDRLIDRFSAPLDLAGRILLSLIFITAGWGKIGGYEGTAGYMESMGVPGMLLPLVIALELGGGIAILLGVLTRLTALALAGFCVLSGVIFHGGDDPMQQILLMKNLAMAGGFLVLAARGAGAFSIDARIARG
jgi:putative oxidoreductase